MHFLPLISNIVLGLVTLGFISSCNKVNTITTVFETKLDLSNLESIGILKD